MTPPRSLQRQRVSCKTPLQLVGKSYQIMGTAFLGAPEEH